MRDFLEHLALQLGRRLVVQGLDQDRGLPRWHKRLFRNWLRRTSSVANQTLDLLKISLKSVHVRLDFILTGDVALRVEVWPGALIGTWQMATELCVVAELPR